MDVFKKEVRAWLRWRRDNPPEIVTEKLRSRLRDLRKELVENDDPSQTQEIREKIAEVEGFLVHDAKEELMQAQVEDIVMYSVQCAICKATYEFEVPLSGLNRRAGGALIQDAFPSLAPPIRELMVSRTCPSCWQELFGLEDDDEIADEEATS